MLDKASNRLSFSLMTAALIIGSSLPINTSAQTFLRTSHHLGTMGYVVAATLGFWLVVSILRSGKLQAHRGCWWGLKQPCLLFKTKARF